MLDSTRPNVLVVEDNVALASVVRFNLQRAGYHVETAANGQEAWTKAKRSHFDLVVSDEQMPVMSGSEFCALLRCDDRYAQTPIPIILLTGKQFEIDTKSLRDKLRISTIMCKPFSPTALLEAVETQLSVTTVG